MKSRGFSFSKRNFYYIANDIAYCIGLDTPSGIMYVTVYVVPLYIPCENRYYTYGKRIHSSDLFPLRSDSDVWAIDEWCTSLCEYLEENVFPFFKTISTPEKLAEYIEQPQYAVTARFSCPEVHIERMKMFTYLYMNDLPKVRKTTDYYRESLLRNTFFTDSVRKKLQAEIDVVLSMVQHDSSQIKNFFDQIKRNTQKYF